MFGLDLSKATMAGIWIAALGVIGLVVRQIVPWRKQETDAEAQFRDALLRRIEKLEKKIERQEQRHQAEQRLSNHKLRNITACFDAILMMLELNPDRSSEIVEQIKAMRSKQIEAEAKELASIIVTNLAEDAEEGER